MHAEQSLSLVSTAIASPELKVDLPNSGSPTLECTSLSLSTSSMASRIVDPRRTNQKLSRLPANSPTPSTKHFPSTLTSKIVGIESRRRTLVLLALKAPPNPLDLNLQVLGFRRVRCFRLRWGGRSRVLDEGLGWTVLGEWEAVDLSLLSLESQRSSDTSLSVSLPSSACPTHGPSSLATSFARF